MTKLEILVSAEKKVTELQATVDKDAAVAKAEKEKVASDLDAKITALGDVNTLTLDAEDNVKATRTAYEALTSDEKGLVTKLEGLESAEKKITELKAAADKAEAERKAAEEKAAAEKAAAEKVEAETKAAAEKAEAEAKAATEKAAADYKAWIDNQFSAWDGSHTALVKLVKENLNDPKSFDHENTVYSDNGNYLTVKMTYRANNAFGALILQNITAKADYETNTISIISQND